MLRVIGLGLGKIICTPIEVYMYTTLSRSQG